MERKALRRGGVGIIEIPDMRKGFWRSSLGDRFHCGGTAAPSLGSSQDADVLVMRQRRWGWSRVDSDADGPSSEYCRRKSRQCRVLGGETSRMQARHIGWWCGEEKAGRKADAGGAERRGKYTVQVKVLL